MLGVHTFSALEADFRGENQPKRLGLGPETRRGAHKQAALLRAEALSARELHLRHGHGGLGAHLHRQPPGGTAPPRPT